MTHELLRLSVENLSLFPQTKTQGVGNVFTERIKFIEGVFSG